MRRFSFLQTQLSGGAHFRQASTNSGSNEKGKATNKKASPVVGEAAPKPPVGEHVPAVKQEGESNTTMKIEKQIEDVKADAKDYHIVKK
jgi:outer membrane biosynthesis protein TonB